MESKSLIFGIVGFILGGLIVALAASASQPAGDSHSHTDDHSHDASSMAEMTESLKDKKGDEFDREFISQMIAHHQGALDMAALAEENAEHTELKQFASDVISTQGKEISTLRSWQSQWNY